MDNHRIDLGSTHNFLNPEVSNIAQIPIDFVECVRVKIANGELTPSEGQSKGIKVTIQNTCFSMNVFILILIGCDMVLGIQWLRELGPILWNFEELSMKFNHMGILVQ